MSQTTSTNCRSAVQIITSKSQLEEAGYAAAIPIERAYFFSTSINIVAPKHIHKSHGRSDKDTPNSWGNHHVKFGGLTWMDSHLVIHRAPTKPMYNPLCSRRYKSMISLMWSDWNFQCKPYNQIPPIPLHSIECINKSFVKNQPTWRNK